MNKYYSLHLLPVNFRNEKNFLLKSEFNTWARLKGLKDLDINFIVSKDPLCTESRLKKIRAISIFVHELEISPSQASLLLHCGIGSIKALSVTDAHLIEKRLRRLERVLQAKTNALPNLLVLKGWVKKAKELIEK